MLRQAAIIGLMSIAIVFTASAQDGERITQLEREVHELKLRLAQLESQLGTPTKALAPVVNSDGWKSVANWRQLQTGMSPDDVRRILGEPERITAGTTTFWSYQGAGQVTFFRGAVEGWSEPRRP